LFFLATFTRDFSNSSKVFNESNYYNGHNFVMMLYNFHIITYSKLFLLCNHRSSTRTQWCWLADNFTPEFLVLLSFSMSNNSTQHLSKCPNNSHKKHNVFSSSYLNLITFYFTPLTSLFSPYIVVMSYLFGLVPYVLCAPKLLLEWYIKSANKIVHGLAYDFRRKANWKITNMYIKIDMK
jgi:hypothetical protein